MFAIQISTETAPKISQSDALSSTDKDMIAKLYLAPRRFAWYLITGYVDHHGGVRDWAVLPEPTFVRHFDFEPEKIKTDWSQIVRKP